MCQCCVEKKDIYLPQLATVADVRQMNVTEKYLRLTMDDGPFDFIPGQFVEVSVFGIGEAPISVSSSPTQGKGFELVVRKVGNVTGALHRLQAGSTIGIRGPFGKNFPIEESKGRDLLFVAGGIGLVPTRSFINYVLDNRKDYGRVIILFGSRSPVERLFTDELASWGKRSDVEYLETVDRGDESWKGNVGVITTLFPKIDINPAKTTCIIVGPPIMYRFAIVEAKKKNIKEEDIIVSLERRMKCGVGKCGHCQINNLYCCLDGPVFKLSDIQPLPEAF